MVHKSHLSSGLDSTGGNQYQVNQISSSIWHIEDRVHPEYHNSMYLISGDQTALLIDTGMGTGDLAGTIASITDLPVEVAITHAHPDHVGQVDQFDTVYFPMNDADSYWHPIIQNEIPISDGSIIELGNRLIEVIAVPGHTRGSVVFLDVGSRSLFTGDAIGSGMMWMQVPKATPLQTYLESLKKLETRITDFDAVFSGHYWQSNWKPLPPEYLTDMRKVVEKVLSGQISSEPFSAGRFSGVMATFQSATIIYKDN